VKRLLAVAGLVAVALLAWSQALPQTLFAVAPIVEIPFIADSVFIEYPDDGSARILYYITSYQRNGAEIVLRTTFPGQPFRTAVRRLLDTVGFVLAQVVEPLSAASGRFRASQEARANFVKNGCVSLGSNAVTRDTILNHSTAVIQHDLGKERRTIWHAPDLGCFVLKYIMEEGRSDGSWFVRGERKTISLNMSP
jgi:hypothetical protein